MEMEQHTHAETIARIRIIFDCILQDNFATTNAVYFEKLITHLSTKENAYILSHTFALEWVDKCLSIISEDFSKVNPKVISFMFNFCSLLASNEWIVIAIKERFIIDKVFHIIERDVSRFSPSIKLGSIRLLSAVSLYSLGLAYIRTKRAWRFLIDYCNRDHTLYVVREARQLLYELLYKFSVNVNDEQIVLEMLQEITKPILENVYDQSSENIIIIVDDSELQHRLGAALELISFIFQQTLESEQKTNIVQKTNIERHDFELTLWKLKDTTQNQHFLEKVMTTLTSYNFALLVYEQWNGGTEIAPDNFARFGTLFFNTMKFCIARREYVNFLKLAELNHKLWKKLGRRAPKEIVIENQRIRFENQLITFHLMPVLFMLKSKERCKEELFEHYIMNLFEINCDHTLRICYAYRDLVLRAEADIGAKMIADLAYKSINGILSMERVLDRDQAVLVFQALAYSLKEFTMHSNSEFGEHANVYSNSNSAAGFKVVDPAASTMVVESPHVLYAVLIGIQTLIQRYRIGWKESIETICLVNVVSVIVKNPNLSARLAVQALKLVQLSIEHFLSPNMALLVDNLQGSGLVCLGPIIVKRFHDTAWEVRDSSLELVTAIANISRLKFPAFQQFLVDYKISPIVCQMAQNDCEPYVRASALKCLTQMVTINMIWEHDLSQLDLIEHLFFVLCNESEGIVRKEAVLTLTRIYDHRKIPNKFINTLYSTFAHCAVADLHWEVKVNALNFWQLEIQKQFTNQGMIDGTFPTVTFSKEHKKIVTLTEKEINLRIVKVFRELSHRGCLGVVLKCLNEDCDLEVIKVAVCIVHRLLEKLKKYDYDAIIDGMQVADVEAALSSTGGSRYGLNEIDNNSLPATIETLPSVAMEEHEAAILANRADEVIESILSSQDINLLISAYETQMQLTNGGECASSSQPTVADNFYRTLANVSAKEFLSIVRLLDLEQLLYNHQKWFMCTESFESLLDDILTTIKPDNISIATITSDCY